MVNHPTSSLPHHHHHYHHHHHHDSSLVSLDRRCENPNPNLTAQRPHNPKNQPIRTLTIVGLQVATPLTPSPSDLTISRDDFVPPSPMVCRHSVLFTTLRAPTSSRGGRALVTSHHWVAHHPRRPVRTARVERNTPTHHQWWAFAPRVASHTSGGWYFEHGGDFVRCPRGWRLDPEVYVIFAGFATLDAEEERFQRNENKG